MLTDDDDVAIVKGVIALAKAFGRSVIAEGAETTEHLVKLKGLGCDSAQGYGIAPPMAAADFLNWVQMNDLAPVLRIP